jgi:hypothetical protein
MTAISLGLQHRLVRKIVKGASLTVFVISFVGALAQNGPYLSDMPKMFPTAYANWSKTLPYAIKPDDWLAKFKGVVSPIRNISLEGRQLKFGTVCVPHDCGDNIAGVLFTPAQDRIFALVNLNSQNGTRTTMLIGQMNGQEISCLRKLIDDDQLTVC